MEMLSWLRVFFVFFCTAIAPAFCVIMPSTDPDNLYLATLNTNAVQRSFYIVVEIANDDVTLLAYSPPIPPNALLPTALGQIPDLEVEGINVTKSITDIIEDGKFEETFTFKVAPNSSVEGGYVLIFTGVTQFLDTDLRAVDFFKYQGVPFPSAVDPALQLNVVTNPIPIHYRLLHQNSDVIAWTSEETGLFIGKNYENNFLIEVDDSSVDSSTKEISFKVSFDADTLAAFENGVYGTNLLVQVNPYDPENLEGNLSYLAQLDIAQTVFLSNIISEADGLLTSQNLVIRLTDAEQAVVEANRTKVVHDLRRFLRVSNQKWDRIAAENPSPTTSVESIITQMQIFTTEQLAIADATPLVSSL